MKFRVFDIIQTMENVWNMEWKKICTYGMKWNGRFLVMERNGMEDFDRYGI